MEAFSRDGSAIRNQWERFLHGEKNTLHIRVERLVVLLLGDLTDRRKRAPSSIHKEDIKAALLSLNLRIQCIKFDQVGGIRTYCLRLFAKSFRRRREFWLTPTIPSHQNLISGTITRWYWFYLGIGLDD